MAVSDKFSCSCRKSPKQKPVLSEGFVNYLQVHSHDYQELRNLKIRVYIYLFVSRINWPEDVSILASTHKPEDTWMWGCKDTSNHTWTWGYEDVRMQEYKQAHMSLRIWGCKDARIDANTYEPEDIRMWGWTWGYEDAGMQARAYEPEDKRM